MQRKELLLVILMEECDETSQRASKAIRFGLNEIQPEQPQTNAQRLIYEFNDIVGVMEFLQEEGLIEKVIDREAIEKKKAKLKKYLKYSEEIGAIPKACTLATRT